MIEIKDKALKVTTNVTSIVGICIGYFIAFVEFENPTTLIITAIITLAFYSIYSIKNKTLGKVFAYILINFMVACLFDYIDFTFDYSQYILPVSL